MDPKDFPQLALVVLVAPLLGFVVQIFVGSRLPRKGDWLPTLCIFISLVLSCVMFFAMMAQPGGRGLEEPPPWKPAWGENWLFSEGAGLTVGFGILVDNLTVVMLLVVSLVSFFVHLYSWGYMQGEARYSRFFAFLGLFSFSMLGLCMTDNLFFLFMFWELVGVCSYFLIGFYFEKKSAQNAAIKAFITTRVGDLGLFVAILMIAATCGSLDFESIFESVEAGEEGPWSSGLLMVAGFCLFLGAMGKSAQFPLHIWLPDAMEGPTPVSALIHAATMVVAGVYLVARMFPFLAGFDYFEGDFFSSPVLLTVAVVGGFTAFFAATIAFAQTDIKKVLAYSTVSQLSYMFIGLGVGSVSAGIFHLFTHAFFKALLFLGAGSVIHAVHSNDMKDMGGLWKKLPITHATFLVATLAIAGFPWLFSGFYSKEAILTQAYDFAQLDGHDSLLYRLPFLLGIVTAGMTAFYMFRLYFRTFWGEPRNAEAHSHAHESPWTMTVPLCVLAFLSVVSGGFWVGDSHLWFEHRVSSEALLAAGATATDPAVHGWLVWTAICMFVLGTGVAAGLFLPAGPGYGVDLTRLAPLRWLHRCLVNLWYIDRFLTWLGVGSLHAFRRACGAFDTVVVDGLVNLWTVVCQVVTASVGAMDYHGVDGAVRGLGETTLRGGRWVRRLQTGFLQAYVYASIFIFAGVVLLSVLLVWSRTGE